MAAVSQSPLPVYGAPVAFDSITTSDTAVQGPYQYLYVGTGGNLALKSLQPGAVAATLNSVPSGSWVPFGQGYIMATNTTASGIVAVG